MFCSRSSNNKINKLHKRALRIVYDDYNSKFEELLIKDGSFTMHHKNIQTLEKEMFKTHHGFSQVSFLDLFHNYNCNFYSLRSQLDFQIPRINTTLKGTESVRYFEPIIWNNIPIETRSIQNVDLFKTNRNHKLETDKLLM